MEDITLYLREIRQTLRGTRFDQINASLKSFKFENPSSEWLCKRVILTTTNNRANS